MSGYPRGIMAAYAVGAITRAQFMSRLAAWQKGRGMDYTCNGTGGNGYFGLSYRGRRAVIGDRAVTWISGGHRHTAGSAAEFRRRVDFEVCEALGGAAWR